MPEPESFLFGPRSYPEPGFRLNALLHAHVPIDTPDGLSILRTRTSPYGTYADGFKEIVDIALQHVLEGTPDTLVYPVGYCLRQYLELRLKELILIAGDLVDQAPRVPTNHDLVKLWNHVRPLLEMIWANAESDFDQVEELLVEFERVDPHPGTAFRYPYDKSDSLSLDGIDYVNLQQIRDAVEIVSPTLDGAAIAIYEFLDAKNTPW